MPPHRFGAGAVSTRSGVAGTAVNARAVAGLLLDETAAAVLSGNAMRVYAGLPQIT